MSKLSQKRKAWNYVSQAKRCSNCGEYRRPGLFLKASLPVESPPLCKLGDFIVGPDGICDKYKSQAMLP